MDVAKQNEILRRLELPIATLTYSGGKSLHAVVKVDAANYGEYQELLTAQRSAFYDLAEELLRSVPALTRSVHQRGLPYFPFLASCRSCLRCILSTRPNLLDQYFWPLKIDPNEQAGAWIRFNPLDGKGVKNENVIDFRYALIE